MEQTGGDPSSAPQPSVLRLACGRCREAHSACEAERPCRRCVRLGVEDTCSDTPPKKRGRPAKDGHHGDGESPLKLASNKGGRNAEKKRNRQAEKGPGTHQPNLRSPVISHHTQQDESHLQLMMVSRMGRIDELLEGLVGQVQHLTANINDARKRLDCVDEALERLQQPAQQGRTPLLITSSDDERSSSPPSDSSIFSLPSRSSSSSIPEWRASFSFERSILQSGVPPGVILEARQQMPWLCHYDVTPSQFAILDWRYPVCVLEKLSSLEVPSFISYANAAFVKLSKYSWMELIGMPFSVLFTGQERYFSQFSHLLYNQDPVSAGKLFSYRPLLRCKDGRLLRLRDRCQLFYNHYGQAQYGIKCIIGWEPGRVQEGESFDRWIPLRPITGPSPLPDSPQDSDTLVLTDEFVQHRPPNIHVNKEPTQPSPLPVPVPSDPRFARFTPQREWELRSAMDPPRPAMPRLLSSRLQNHFTSLARFAHRSNEEGERQRQRQPSNPPPHHFEPPPTYHQHHRAHDQRPHYLDGILDDDGTEG